MQHINLLLFSELAGGTAPYRDDDLAIEFHTQADPGGSPPAMAGALFAYVDWVLPNISGLEVCRRLRCDPRTAGAHLAMVIDDDEPAGVRQRAFRAGADECLRGPVDRAAIIGHLRALTVAPAPEAAPNVLSHADMVIDLAAFEARWHGKRIPMMPTQFRLLRHLLEHHGRIFTREQLIEVLGPHEGRLHERTVDVWIGRLRHALDQVGAGDLLRTVRSRGYVFDHLGREPQLESPRR